jgi:hypothetical protein
LEQRVREYKYRCAQSVVFGVPVVALQLWGSALGPSDAWKWVPLLQALLSGWVVYVNLGMLIEGVIVVRRAVTGDLMTIVIALGLYLFSVISTARILFGEVRQPRLILFHAVVILLAFWTGIQWFRFARTYEQR